MKIDSQFCCLPALALLALAAASPLGAQTKAPPRAGEQEPGAAELAPPVYAHVEIGPRTVLMGTEKEKLGTLQDFVVDRGTGSTLFAIVQVQDGEQTKSVLVPPDRFSWSEERMDLVLHSTPTELAALPEYEPEKLQRLRDPSKPRSDEPESEDGVVAGGERPAGGFQEAAMTEAGRNILASELVQASVSGTDGPFGTVSGLIFEPYEARIAFVFVRSGPEPEPGKERDHHIVPWRALKRLDDGRLVIPMTVAELANAPRFSKARLKPLRQEETRADIYEFYGVERHAEHDERDTGRPGGR